MTRRPTKRRRFWLFFSRHSDDVKDDNALVFFHEPVNGALKQLATPVTEFHEGDILLASEDAAKVIEKLREIIRRCGAEQTGPESDACILASETIAVIKGVIP